MRPTSRPQPRIGWDLDTLVAGLDHQASGLEHCSDSDLNSDGSEAAVDAEDRGRSEAGGGRR
jgi:predicted AAA+ superfamily ATPase